MPINKFDKDTMESFKFNQLILSLLDYGFLTGSRAFGTEREDSDYDIAYPMRHDDIVSELLSAYKFENSMYFNGSKHTVGKRIINKIPLNECEVAPWVFATKAMIATYKETGVVDKQTKYGMFQTLTGMYKMALRLPDNLVTTKLQEYNDKLIKEFNNL